MRVRRNLFSLGFVRRNSMVVVAQCSRCKWRCDAMRKGGGRRVERPDSIRWVSVRVRRVRSWLRRRRKTEREEETTMLSDARESEMRATTGLEFGDGWAQHLRLRGACSLQLFFSLFCLGLGGRRLLFFGRGRGVVGAGQDLRGQSMGPSGICRDAVEESNRRLPSITAVSVDEGAVLWPMPTPRSRLPVSRSATMQADGLQKARDDTSWLAAGLLTLFLSSLGRRETN